MSSFGKQNIHRLLKEGVDFALPTFDKEEPEVLTPTMLFLLSMCNSKLLTQLKIDKIFSSSSSGFSFQKLVYAMKGYNGPIVLLVRNRYNTIEKSLQKNQQHWRVRSLFELRAK